VNANANPILKMPNPVDPTSPATATAMATAIATAVNLMMKFHEHPRSKANPLYLRLHHPRTLNQMKRVRKPKPEPYDPASYVSAQDETAKLETAKRKAQSHVSYAFKTTTTMWIFWFHMRAACLRP